MASSMELWKKMKTSSRQMLNAFSHMFRNPSMTNPTIIQLLGDNLPPQSLISLRSLNSLCKSTLHPSFCAKVHVKFLNLQQLLAYTLEINPEVHQNFDFFFSIRLDPQSYLQLSPFFGKYGSQITTLRLRMSWNEEESYKIFQASILPKLPNLKTLDLRLVLRETWLFQFDPLIPGLPLPSVTKLTLQLREENEQGLPIQILQRQMENFSEMISKTFPNLEDITLEDYSSYFDDNSEFYKRFLKILERKNTPFLKGFHIALGDFETISNLAQLDMTHLTSLTVQFFNLDLSGGAAEAVNQLLKNQSSSLKSLRLLGIEPIQIQEEVEYEIALQLPSMKNLETLFLKFNMGEDGEINADTKLTFAKDFDLNEMFPILKSYKLHVESEIPAAVEMPLREKIHEKFIPKEVCLSVKTFDVEYPFVKAEDFKIEGGDENSEGRRKKYKDFVTKLTLIFPNAVNKSGFPKPPPIEGNNRFKMTEEMELVTRNPDDHFDGDDVGAGDFENFDDDEEDELNMEELVALALNHLMQDNEDDAEMMALIAPGLNDPDPGIQDHEVNEEEVMAMIALLDADPVVIQDDEENVEEMMALIAPNGLNADPLIQDNPLNDEENVEEMMEMIALALNDPAPDPDPVIEDNQLNDDDGANDEVMANALPE